MNNDLIGMVEDYLNMVITANFRQKRQETHQGILRKMGFRGQSQEKIAQVNEILHNLDREIGFKIGIKYDNEDIHKLAIKLLNKVREQTGVAPVVERPKRGKRTIYA